MYGFGRFSRILSAAICDAMNMALVFGTLTTILFLIHQFWKFFKSSFRHFVRFKIDGSEPDRVASSANRSRMHVEELLLLCVGVLIASLKCELVGNDLFKYD